MTDTLESALAELVAARAAYDEAPRAGWYPPADVSERLLAAHARVTSQARGERAVCLTALPLCDAGAPMPLVLGDGHSVWLSYFGADEPFFSERAVVKFTGVDSVTFGGANDEALHGHRLWGKGLELYSFHEVIASQWIATRERENSVHERHRPATFARLRHFVYTFHDDTFECLAAGFAVDSSGIGSPLGELSEIEARTQSRSCGS